MKIREAHNPTLVVDPAVASIVGISTETDAEIATLAYVATGEKPHACYGHHITRFGDGTASVKIYKD